CSFAEVPSESRSFAGADRLFFSDPLICEGDEQLPPVALLRTNRTSAEFYATRNMAAYILQCLELLGERNPVHLLNVVFVLSHANGFQPSGVPEKFETKRDVCVISSPLLISLPYSVLDINAILSSIKQLDIERCRSLPRIVTQTGNNGSYVLRHTFGGATASLLGAVVHEIGHLFKLPHTKFGIMKTGIAFFILFHILGDIFTSH
ncbi:hypothetical protein Tcan_11331, partial [Toxocara canis]